MMRVLAIIALVLPLAAYGDDKAKAVALFDEGQREMKAGNFEKACEAFRQSLALKVDSGTRGSLARCYEKVGKVASAYKLWVVLSATAPERLRPDALANAKNLEPRLPYFTVKLAPNAPPKIAITLNGEEIEWKPDEPQPIDPGPYVLEAKAASYSTFRKEFTAAEGKTEEIAIPFAPKPVVVEPAPSPPPPVETPPPARSGTGRKIGYALIATGGALAIGGGVLGIVAKGRYDDAKDICGGDIDACDPARTADAQDKVDSARTAGTMSTLSFIVGGAAIVGGVVLVVRSPKRAPGVAIVPTGDGIAITGGF